MGLGLVVIKCYQHALVIQGGSLGGWVWWRDVCSLTNVCLLFLRVDCEFNRPSFLATAFKFASSFNGDLKQWNVAKVTTMEGCKSILIRILEISK